jgi:hypothetical protein
MDSQTVHAANAFPAEHGGLDPVVPHELLRHLKQRGYDAQIEVEPLLAATPPQNWARALRAGLGHG